jgi:hypothetical protein
VSKRKGSKNQKRNEAQVKGDKNRKYRGHGAKRKGSR